MDVYSLSMIVYEIATLHHDQMLKLNVYTLKVFSKTRAKNPNIYSLTNDGNQVFKWLLNKILIK